MRFRSKKSQPNVILSQRNRANEDRLAEDASLKAAQAIFKKHSMNKETQPPALSSVNPISAPSKNASGLRAYSMRSSPSAHTSLLPNSPENHGLSQRAASAAIDISNQSESSILQLDSNLLLPPSMAHEEGAAKDKLSSWPSSRNSSRNSLRHSPTHSLIAEKLHYSSLENAPSLDIQNNELEIKKHRNNSREDISSATSEQLPKNSSTVSLPQRTLTGRKPPPVEFEDSHRHSPVQLDASSVHYYDTNRTQIPITYEGTLPDLIPAHLRPRKKKWHTIFRNGKDTNVSTSSELKLNKEDENATIKSTHANQTKLRTTLRTDNLVAENNTSQKWESDNSSDESAFSSDSDRDTSLISENESHARRGHRSMIRSHKQRLFNEDKPWKSHVDIGFVSEKERKRYEGIWVSNRNSYLELLPWWDQNLEIPEDGLMLNLIVHELWSRSNLPDQLLAQIYDKVDTRHDATLTRQSFVTGMWLIDQCLYGRKLPKEIDQRVWDSVDKFVINIPNTNPHHHYRRRKKLLRKELKTIKKDIKALQL